MRGAVYVDGFNLYHAIDDLKKPYLKWLNLWRLSELIARGHAQTITKVVYGTAYFPGDHGKKVRHTFYVEALKLVDVEVKLGHVIKEPMKCPDKNCAYRWDANREKETDINIALSLFDDAYQDIFDVAFLVTADTDQVATLKFMKMRFPTKKVIVVWPPDRQPSKHLLDWTDGKVSLTEDHLDQCVLPDIVFKDDHKSIVRPYEYDPPEGWVHPDKRPKRSIPRPP